MKATKYIAAIALLLGLVACQPNEMFNGGSQADAENVEVNFSVKFPEPIPVSTKAPMGEAPTADAFDIYLCLFGPGDGAFQNWIKVKPEDMTFVTDATGTHGTFKALLPVAEDQRTVHLFVNPPITTAPAASDYIDGVMENMVTTDGEGAYWQEIVLPNGIYPDPNNGLKAHTDINTAFSNVQLLRNFAKISVDGPYNVDGQLEEKFELKSWALINVPKKGYVAPYTRKEEGLARFPQGYSNAFLNTPDWTAESLLTQLVVTDKYKGYMPPVPDGENIINTDFPTTFFNDRQATYMYERPVPDLDRTDEKQTSVLIEIEFQEGHALYNYAEGANNTYWYKVEVLDNNGAYVPILRNFVYKMHILGLEEKGELTAEAAFNGPYFGNISASLETASLNELSNGKSQIHVDLLDYTFMAIPPGGEILLTKDGTNASEFWFIPNVNDPTSTIPMGAAYNESNEYCTIRDSLLTVPGYTASTKRAIASQEDVIISHGTITIRPTAVPTDGSMKKSIIRIKGKSAATGSKELYREIMITLMSQPSFKHGAEPTKLLTNAATGVGTPVKLQICLPEGLGSSLFPIQVRIEAEENTLSATSPDLPVQTGKSKFDPNRNTFFYIYTINYSDYCWLDPTTKKYDYRYVFGNPDASGFSDDPEIVLYTNKTGDNSTKINISDMNGMFLDTELTLGTVEP